MHHLPDTPQRFTSDVSPALLLAQLQDDPLVRESIALLPPVLLIALLHVQAHVGWDACFAVVRQLNNDHGRHMRELSTALSLLRSLRGTRILDPLVWHAVARRLLHAIADELHVMHSMPARAPRRCISTNDGLNRRTHALQTLRHGMQTLELWRYWLAARTSAPLTWL